MIAESDVVTFMVGRKKEKNIVFLLSHRIGIMLLIFEYIKFENDADVSYNEFLVDFINALDVKNKPVLQNILQGLPNGNIGSICIFI